MDPWNYTYIVIGLASFISVLTRNKFTSYDERLLAKLELKYGNIDRKKAIKFDYFHSYLIGIVFILIGLLIRERILGLISGVTIIILLGIGYYPVIKKYIAKDEL